MVGVVGVQSAASMAPCAVLSRMCSWQHSLAQGASGLCVCGQFASSRQVAVQDACLVLRCMSFQGQYPASSIARAVQALLCAFSLPILGVLAPSAGCGGTSVAAAVVLVL